MDSIIFGIFAVIYTALVIWLLRNHHWTLSSVLLVVILALIFDNGMIALGTTIGEGDTLELFNKGRFWLHAICTPMLILFSLAVIREAGIRWAKKSWALLVAMIYTIAAIIVEYTSVLNGLTLKAVEEYGALSYSSVEESSGPPVMILLVLVALLIAGAMLLWKLKWPWMLVGTIVMTVGSAVQLDLGSNAITNAFELFLLVTLVMTKKKVNHINIY